jgi:transcriptional regulator with XRE-family HTH domain
MKTEFELRFGELLRTGRIQVGLTVRQLGRLTGIDPTYISRMERGIAPLPQSPRSQR